MRPIQITVDDAYVYEINKLVQDINGTVYSPRMTANEIAKEALAVYRWVLQQTHQGKAVVAANGALDSLVQISTPMLPAKPPTV